MSDLKKIFFVVNDGDSLTAFRQKDDAPWFKVERAKCYGKDLAEQQESFGEAVKFILTAFGPLADYRQVRSPGQEMERATTPRP